MTAGQVLTRCWFNHQTNTSPGSFSVNVTFQFKLDLYLIAFIFLLGRVMTAGQVLTRCWCNHLANTGPSSFSVNVTFHLKLDLHLIAFIFLLGRPQ